MSSKDPRRELKGGAISQACAYIHTYLLTYDVLSYVFMYVHVCLFHCLLGVMRGADLFPIP